MRSKLFFLYVTFLLFVGCSSTPAPPQEVNAKLEDLSPYIITKPDKTTADTLVVAQCKKINEYAVTKQNKNWRYHWYYTEWDVINVEKGKWPEPQIKFVFRDSWPTPESGIIIDKQEHPYQKGRIFFFEFDMSRKEPLIIAQEQRSYIPPHNPIVIPHITDSNKLDTIFEVSREFLLEHNIKGSYSSFSEETEEYYVFEVRYEDANNKIILIDKESLTPEWLQ